MALDEYNPYESLRRQADTTEMIILHKMMNSVNNCHKVMSSGVNLDHFHPENYAHQEIFKACSVLAMDGENISPMIVDQKLSEMGTHDVVGNTGVLEVDQVGFDAVTPLDVALDSMKRIDTRRKIVKAASAAINDAADSSHDPVQTATRMAAEFESIIAGTTSVTAVENASLDAIRNVIYDLSNKGLDPGIGNVGDYYRFAPGELVVVTGHSHSGKSTFVAALLASLARDHGVRSLIWNSEHKNEKYARKMLSQLVHDPLKFDGSIESQDRIEKRIAPWGDFLREHFMLFTDVEDRRTIPAVLSTALMYHRMKPFQILVLDTWTDLSTANSQAWSETDAHKEMLTVARQFAKKHGITVMIVAHPTKGLPYEEIPMLKHISGSAHFNNLADVGITVFRPAYARMDMVSKDAPEDLSQIFVTKMREEDHGRLGQANLRFSPNRGFFDAY